MEENELPEESVDPIQHASEAASTGEALAESEQSGAITESPACLNCGAELQGAFCHACGQKNIPKRQTLGELLTNFISSFWSYEGKFFLTTRYLFLRPGFLATEYNAGRRERYYHPARMYVFISFVFFLLFSTLSGDSELDMAQLDNEDVKELREELPKANVDSLLQRAGKRLPNGDIEISTNWLDSLRGAHGKGQRVSLTKLEYENFSAYDSAQQLLPEKERDGWVVRKLTERNLELNKRYTRSSDFGKDFLKALDENFSKILFVLLPIFALLLKLLYIRRDYFYSEHLVFSIYYYNFAFLTLSLQLLANEVPWLGWLGQLLGLWLVIYLLVGMKRVYRQSWRKTLAKWFLFLFLFLIAIALVVALWAFFILFTI